MHFWHGSATAEPARVAGSIAVGAVWVASRRLKWFLSRNKIVFSKGDLFGAEQPGGGTCHLFRAFSDCHDWRCAEHWNIWSIQFIYICILPDCPDWSCVCIHWKGGGRFDWQSWQKYLIKIYIDFLWHDFQRFFQQTLLLWTKAEKLFLLPVWKGSFWKIMEKVYLSICAAGFVLGKTRSTSTPVFPALKLKCF